MLKQLQTNDTNQEITTSKCKVCLKSCEILQREVCSLICRIKDCVTINTDNCWIVIKHIKWGGKHYNGRKFSILAFKPHDDQIKLDLNNYTIWSTCKGSYCYKDISDCINPDHLKVVSRKEYRNLLRDKDLQERQDRANAQLRIKEQKKLQGIIECCKCSDEFIGQPPNDAKYCSLACCLEGNTTTERNCWLPMNDQFIYRDTVLNAYDAAYILKFYTIPEAAHQKLGCPEQDKCVRPTHLKILTTHDKFLSHLTERQQDNFNRGYGWTLYSFLQQAIIKDDLDLALGLLKKLNDFENSEYSDAANYFEERKAKKKGYFNRADNLSDLLMNS